MSEQPVAGRAFGPYIVESLIGSGGMGHVYRGRDSRLHRSVAIKIIQPERCSSEMMRRRFETEARSAARLAHPNVVQIYDVGEDDGTEALLFALRNDAAHAAEQIRRAEELGSGNPHFHHPAVVLAAASAELQQPAEAVRFLTIAADTGMPNYPLFTNNPSLRKLKGNPVYDQFIASLKPRWEQIAAEATK